jgi:hypothetical protein
LAAAWSPSSAATATIPTASGSPAPILPLPSTPSPTPFPGGLQRGAVLSDGATRLVDRFGLLDWPSFLDVLAKHGPDAIIQRVRAAEDSDPDGRRWPRGKRHDDASAAFCHLT